MNKGSAKGVGITVFQLMGGFGNQLFQLSAALYYQEATGNRVKFISRKKNLYIEGLIEVIFSDHALLDLEGGLKPFLRRTIGVLLRLGTSSGNPLRKLVYRTLNHFANFLAKYLYGVKSVVMMPQLDSVLISDSVEDRLVVGYFQSHSTSESKEIRRNLKRGLIEPTSTEYTFLKEKMGSTALVVHIRLGDYVGESDFGILSPSYYQEALGRIRLDEVKSIWVFSDSPKKAKKRYGHIIEEIAASKEGLVSNLYWIDKVDDSDYATWYLMNNGSAFVIGNSSYSWWAARLSKCSGEKIVSPIPWFNSIRSPADIAPKDWTLMRSDFLDSSMMEDKP